MIQLSFCLHPGSLSAMLNVDVFIGEIFLFIVEEEKQWIINIIRVWHWMFQLKIKGQSASSH